MCYVKQTLRTQRSDVCSRSGKPHENLGKKKIKIWKIEKSQIKAQTHSTFYGGASIFPSGFARRAHADVHEERAAGAGPGWR